MKPAGDFAREVYCRCGAWLDLFTRAVGLRVEKEYVDPDTGEVTTRCPQCNSRLDDALTLRYLR